MGFELIARSAEALTGLSVLDLLSAVLIVAGCLLVARRKKQPLPPEQTAI